MIDQPKVVEVPRQLSAVIQLVIPKNRIQEVMRPGLDEIYSTLSKQRIAPAGPWFTHHFRMAPDVWDFEIGVPVPHAVTPSGRVQSNEQPACRVARTILHGSYDGLAKAWGELKAWVTANGHTAAPDIREVYLAGPESSANPNDWKTQLDQPLVDAQR